LPACSPLRSQFCFFIIYIYVATHAFIVVEPTVNSCTPKKTKKTKKTKKNKTKQNKNKKEYKNRAVDTISARVEGFFGQLEEQVQALRKV
jgi:ribosomal protein S30